MDMLNNKYYHGSKKYFESFESNKSYGSKRRFVIGAFWFSNSLNVAQSYGNYVYEVKLNIENPYIVDANFENYSEIYLSELPTEIGIQIDLIDNRNPGDTINEINYRKQTDPEHFIKFDTKDLALAAMRAGYDSLIVKNVIDAGNKSALKIFAITLAVFNNSQIKIEKINTKEYA